MGEAGASPPTATSAQPIVTQLSKRQTSSKKKRDFFRFFLGGGPRIGPGPGVVVAGAAHIPSLP